MHNNETHPPRISDRRAMLANMTPVLRDGLYHYCTTTDIQLATSLYDQCLAFFSEDEGFTLVLEESVALANGLISATPMVRIVLEVYSDLEGVGLTAGVASALADHNIPCNVVAAFHHDHVFVPTVYGSQALEVLLALQREASGDTAAR